MSNLLAGWHTIPKWRKALYAVGIPVGAVFAVVLYVI